MAGTRATYPQYKPESLDFSWQNRLLLNGGDATKLMPLANNPKVREQAIATVVTLRKAIGMK